MCVLWRSRLLDVSLLEAYRSELDSTTTYRQPVLLAYQSLLHTCTDILQLLHSCCGQDSSVRQYVLQEPSTLKQIVKLLGVAYQGNL